LYAKADSPPELDEEESETVSLVEERVEPQKKEVIEEAIIVKEPVRETKQIKIPLKREEIESTKQSMRKK
jgi:stress response protein YsnF